MRLNIRCLKLLKQAPVVAKVWRLQLTEFQRPSCPLHRHQGPVRLENLPRVFEPGHLFYIFVNFFYIYHLFWTRSPGKVFLNFGKNVSSTILVNFTHLHHHQQKYDHHHHHHHYHQQYHPHQHHRPHHNIHHDYLRRRVAMDSTVNFHLNRSILRWTPLLVHCHFRGGCKDWNFIIMIRNIMHNDDNNDNHEIVSHHHGDNHDQCTPQTAWLNVWFFFVWFWQIYTYIHRPKLTNR